MVLAVLVLMVVSTIIARPFGVWSVPSIDPNVVEMQYGGTVRIEIVGQTIHPAVEDPNVLVLTIRLHVSE